jgi:hypothetical protein
MFTHATKLLTRRQVLSKAISSTNVWNHSSSKAVHQVQAQATSTTAFSSLSEMAYSIHKEAKLEGLWDPQLTKIVATIGPTSEQLPEMQDLVRCGMRIMRLNFSHATIEEVELRTKNLNLCKVSTIVVVLVVVKRRE